MPPFVRIRFAGLVLAVIASTASADGPAAARLCGFSPREWSTNVAAAMGQRRGNPLPFTYWNLALAVAMFDLADRTNDEQLRAYAGRQRRLSLHANLRQA